MMICCSVVFADLLPYNIMKMHLLASIDVGSNTFRLLIGKISQKNRLIDVFSDRIITRLGDRVGETGRLQERNMADSLSALRRFASILTEYHVEQISAISTSASGKHRMPTALFKGYWPKPVSG